MKMLIISDSHGSKEKVIELSEKYINYTKIHLGDIGFDENILKRYNYIFVHGNCDKNQDTKVIEKIFDETKVLITHGDLFNVKYSLLKLYYEALSRNVKFVFYGHTHIQNIVKKDDITFINPGSILDNKYCVINGDEIKFF